MTPPIGDISGRYATCPLEVRVVWTARARSQGAEPQIAAPLLERREPPAQRMHRDDDERPDQVDDRQ